jgi:hypothetical protein
MSTLFSFLIGCGTWLLNANLKTLPNHIEKFERAIAFFVLKAKNI